MDKDIHIKYKTEEGKEKYNKEYDAIESKKQSIYKYSDRAFSSW